jgi:CRP-like cAMP-binding protein
VHALRDVPSLAAIDDGTMLEIVGDSSNLVWAAGSTIYAAGTPGDALYIVLSGRVRVVGEGGRELAALGPGSFFGEMSLLLGTHHAQTVEAVEDAELMVVPRDRFDAIMASNEDVAAAIRRSAGERHAANVRAGLS